jgi:hypothetical protein
MEVSKACEYIYPQKQGAVMPVSDCAYSARLLSAGRATVFRLRALFKPPTSGLLPGFGALCDVQCDGHTRGE